MIKELTKEQRAKFPEYIDKWVKVGLSTERVDFMVAKEVSDFYYEKIAGKKKVPVVVLRSPLEAWIAVCMFNGAQVSAQVRAQVFAQVSDQVSAQVSAQVRDQVRDQVYAQVSAQVSDQVYAQVYAQVRAQVRDQVSAQVSAQVSDQVRDQVRAQVFAQVYAQVRAQVSEMELFAFVWPYIDGHYWSNYFSFYEFIRLELGIKYHCFEKYEWLRKTMSLGLMYPLKNICIICDKPLFVKKGKNGLHCENGKALEYPDGWALYSLNGIRVPAWIVETDKDDITVEQMLKIENADVRRECLRKMGVDKLINHGKEIDAQGSYKLIDLGKLFLDRGNFYAPYLVMKNPSVEGLYHCEGVHEDCKTVEQALNWRNGSKAKPVILT